ncbi:MAG: TIGR01777 family oxidoreductase [Deltaproteobacteria bacterium]|nr:TIGR01777 family oxidoreductase [Deltaproteobacteria bacterium]
MTSIAVTGSTGLVGRALCSTLREANPSIRVRPMVRRPVDDPEAVVWTAEDGLAEAGALDGVDAVVHLAGEPIGPARWTAERKQRIADSRVLGTRRLVETLTGGATPPKVLVQASAVGFYGDTGDTWADESSPNGAGFLAGVCRDWEEASSAAEEAGIRVVRLRFGHVLAQGGLLGSLRGPTRLGLGGRLGSGRQFWSWIAIPDLVSIVLHAVSDPGWTGVLNAVAPAPTRNADFSREYAAVLRRPAWLPAPRFALRLAFGGEQAHEMLLWGQRVRPAGLQRLGFRHAHSDLRTVLESVEAGTLSMPLEQAASMTVAGGN